MPELERIMQQEYGGYEIRKLEKGIKKGLLIQWLPHFKDHSRIHNYLHTQRLR